MPGKIAYRGPVGPSIGYRSLPRLKIDLTFDEILVLPKVEREIHHEYSDIHPSQQQPCVIPLKKLPLKNFLR